MMDQQCIHIKQDWVIFILIVMIMLKPGICQITGKSLKIEADIQKLQLQQALKMYRIMMHMGYKRISISPHYSTSFVGGSGIPQDLPHLHGEYRVK